MRIDKFLKISRLIKRRTVAKEACEWGRIKINDKTAKPGDDVKIGDIIEISLGQGDFKCRVVDLREHVGKNEAQSLYESL
ncbi:S4 domain [Urinicoccus massiliensis]|uniref:RQC P-site tRNA stabilizing factor n=1 Tax=Urinicoccus massiliensis TaxID=1723382 RepID=A0A8H2R0Z5_9FIRM|nr:RNA-binding S4 domain-containing protein [Urinicoccus massiliensis]VFB16153.1 S4 domain [Urinicoccus massiliensis]